MSIVTQGVDTKFNYRDTSLDIRLTSGMHLLCFPSSAKLGLKGYHPTTHMVNSLRA